MIQHPNLKKRKKKWHAYLMKEKMARVPNEKERK